jgi:hypothetical protein
MMMMMMMMMMMVRFAHVYSILTTRPVKVGPADNEIGALDPIATPPDPRR